MNTIFSCDKCSPAVRQEMVHTIDRRESENDDKSHNNCPKVKWSAVQL